MWYNRMFLSWRPPLSLLAPYICDRSAPNCSLNVSIWSPSSTMFYLRPSSSPCSVASRL
jgi:hypothetical protein